jgi:hypothetical protein
VLSDKILYLLESSNYPAPPKPVIGFGQVFLLTDGVPASSPKTAVRQMTPKKRLLTKDGQIQLQIEGARLENSGKIRRFICDYH